MEAELQAVLKTLTEHNFQDGFKKNGRSAETTSKLMVASMPKVNFRPDGRTNTVNYGYKFIKKLHGLSP
jgi:hypothetical protein